MLKHINSEVFLTRPITVLFDTDNTLYDYGPANHIANQAAERKAGNLLGISSDIYKAAFKQARQDVKVRLGHTASSHNRLLYFQRMLEILGFKAQLLIALDLEQTFWRTFLVNAPLFPGVVEFLQLLRRQNVPIAIVTDLTAHVQLRKLTHFRLEETFDAVVTSEEVGADKPDKRNFELVLDKLKVNTNDGQVWMIGDSPSADIRGGKTIGAVTFQKVHGDLKISSGKDAPDYAFSSFLELHEYTLQKILSDQTPELTTVKNIAK